MDPNGVKKLKRGEILFKEGDSAQSVYMIQSGKIGLMLERGSKRLEVAVLGPSQVVGEGGLFSTAKQAFTAEALQETKLLEVPLDLMKAQFEKSPPGVKLMVKSMVEDMRQSRQQAKLAKMDAEKSPCPQGMIHRIFTELHLIARHIGKKDPAQADRITISWSSLKMYASRFFGESPNRMRTLMDLLTKLKMAELKIIKPEDAEDDQETLSEVVLTHLQVCEDFAEFYQYHLFKGGRAEAIYVDPLALKVAKAIYEISSLAEIDHKGNSKLDYAFVVGECKSKFKIDLKNSARWRNIGPLFLKLISGMSVARLI